MTVTSLHSGDEQAFIEVVRWLVEDAQARRRVRLNAHQHTGKQGWLAIVEQFEKALLQTHTAS